MTTRLPTLASGHDLLLLDLDGVLYVGAEAVPHAVEALAALPPPCRPLFVTNNASRTPDTVAAHLSALGVQAQADDVLTSAEAAADHLAATLPAGARILVIGGEGLQRAVAQRGLAVTPPGDVVLEETEGRPVAVVMGFGPQVGWRDLAVAAQVVGRGARFVATNLDRTVPTPQGPAPGNGMLVAAVAAASREPDVVLGKPEPGLFRSAVARAGAHSPLVVGDRLDTDIAGAERADLPSLLVLTGVTSPSDVVLAPRGQRPTYVGRDLRSLHAPPADPARPEPGTHDWRVGAFVASCSASGVVRVRHDPIRSNRDALEAAPVPEAGDGLDGLRAACACAWALPDGHVHDVSGPLDTGAE